MAATDPPTSRQLAYLRRLADRAGQTFAFPADRLAASREIDRLRSAARSSRVERRRDTQAVGADQRGALDSVRVHDDEVIGYGADARWKGQER